MVSSLKVKYNDLPKTCPTFTSYTIIEMTAKEPLRNHIRNFIVQEIQSGSLEFGKSLNLAKIARKLSVSVTPVREALSQLEKVGVVKAVPNIGFVLALPEVEIIKPLYETLAALEGLAVEGCDYNNSHWDLLTQQAQLISQCTDEKKYYEYKFKFHKNLIKPTKNTVLAEIVYDLFLRIQFYEMLYVSQMKPLEKVQNKYEPLVKAIREDNLPMAALILRMNWSTAASQLEQCIIEDIKVRL